MNTGAARFQLRAGGCFPFDTVEIDGTGVIDARGSGLAVTDARGIRRPAEVLSVEVEERGPLRSVVQSDAAAFRSAGGASTSIARIHFFAGLPTVRVLVTLTNPNRAQHRGGFWDLGDPGIDSDQGRIALICACRLDGGRRTVRLAGNRRAMGEVRRRRSSCTRTRAAASTGRARTTSTASGACRTPFAAIVCARAAARRPGLRATPIVALARGAAGVAVTTPHFWQNFPKAIEADGRTLDVRLFPRPVRATSTRSRAASRRRTSCSSRSARTASRPCRSDWCRARTLAGAAPEWCLAVRRGAVSGAARADEHAALVNAGDRRPEPVRAEARGDRRVRLAALRRDLRRPRSRSATRARRRSSRTTTISTTRSPASPISSCAPAIRAGGP